MALNRFSKFLKGTKDYLDLLIELSKIYKLNDFYVLVHHCGDIYRIRGIYDHDFKKLRYPKNFRKSIYGAEPEAIIKREDDSRKLNLTNEKINICLLHRVYFQPSFINVKSPYRIINQINKHNPDFNNSSFHIIRAPLSNINDYKVYIE